ncbi:MAG: hypothetical protein ACW975_13875 [Candidatus Thorarchaeota archaeon]
MNSKDRLIRFLGLVLATALLNVGLYVVLWVAAPLVSGFICGYVMLSPKWGALGGLLGSVVSTTPLLFFLESIASSGADIYSILTAAIILSVIGALGGLSGGMSVIRFQNRMQT